MKKYFLTMSFALCHIGTAVYAQQGLVNTGKSPYAALSTVDLGAVHFTHGFWAERFAVCRDEMVPTLWKTYTSDTVCYAFQNFRIAAGLDTGVFRGPSFHDGDFYKTLEALAAMYAVTKDPGLYQRMEQAIAVIGKAQRADGYIYTKNIIDQQHTGAQKMFDDKLSFEAYNFGHLMTAACVHYRATGKTSLLHIAEKAADFLIGFYNTATPEQARNAICPSHYMGLAELYRTTNQGRYLNLLKKLIDIRGTVEGTDDNSDRAPFREMKKIVGHAVRANYLMAGVADLYAENGDQTLKHTLDQLWSNVCTTKMYITGGCGALYDGVSVDGTSYKPDTVQKVHQSYGRDYQLPNLSAHNETCANIGNVLWNWRMFLLTADERYMNIVELALYNSVLSGVSLDGKDYFYTNPLAAAKDYPYQLRWSGGRQPYISLSNCCPPNLVRTVAEAGNYMYSIGKQGLYINTYSDNQLKTKWQDGSEVQLTQQSNYPWEGRVIITIQKAPATMPVYLRIPGWCKSAAIKYKGSIKKVKGGQYVPVDNSWKPGDKIELVLEMPVQLVESNPLVEETRNQVAVKRGPIVYCMESPDYKGNNITDIRIPADIRLHPVPVALGHTRLMALTGTAKAVADENWDQVLYREIKKELRPVPVTLIPYYAWANRGQSDMRVWLPLIR
ncbi:glycoside hydrolase family 127 protein [Niabella pedocola]|uniref:Glycoside hydrolase family 127 protein n=1 Tax=Niabella pedocola TaxID=1752077 RepID=A0ABS8PZW3_9BACT|nr:glycoside hydrolase family 127 protein [Niabella pedocola]MCD2425888.1 glycoside hydrolase family 127 protein [Niabella pedocola]